MLEHLPTSDAARSAAPGSAVPPTGDRRRSGDAYVDQLRNLLLKAAERARTAEQALEAVQRELATAQARLVEEMANSAVLTEMAGEAERRAMKAEATAETLRLHLSGARPEPAAELPRVPGVPRPSAPAPSARQVLDGMVSHLHAVPAEPEPSVPVRVAREALLSVVDQTQAAAPGQSWATEHPEPQPEAAALPSAPVASAPPSPREPEPVAAEAAPLAAVTILPGGSSSPKRRWGR